MSNPNLSQYPDPMMVPWCVDDPEVEVEQHIPGVYLVDLLERLYHESEE